MIQYVIFCIWHYFHSVMFLKYIHFVEYVSKCFQNRQVIILGLLFKYVHPFIPTYRNFVQVIILSYVADFNKLLIGL